MNITERDSTGETSKTRRHEATFSGVHLERTETTCLSIAFGINHLPDSICDLRGIRDQYSIILQVALFEIPIDALKQKVTSW
jgi:hypothetical protein